LVTNTVLQNSTCEQHLQCTVSAILMILKRLLYFMEDTEY